MAGSDSNWGRIIMALGKGTVPLDYKKISIKFGEFFVFNNEKNLSISNTSQINKYLRGNEIFISIKIGKQNGEAKVWTCDLTKDYISINADYRS